jgi:four helix bundle protein
MAFRVHLGSEKMTARADELKCRTKRFALDVLAFVRTLPNTDDVRTMSRQLVRAATGAAANYRSACRARSKAEFIARIGIALEESDESGLWFELLTESGTTNAPEAFRLLGEANELSAILAASSITAQSTLHRH